MPVARDADSGARPRRASSRQPAPHLCSHRRLQGALGAGAPAVAARPQPRPPACDCPAHLAPTCPRLPGWGGGTSEEGVPWLLEGVQLRDLITSGPWGQSTPSGALASELLKVPTVCQMVSWRLDVQWSTDTGRTHGLPSRGGRRGPGNHGRRKVTAMPWPPRTALGVHVGGLARRGGGGQGRLPQEVLSQPRSCGRKARKGILNGSVHGLVLDEQRDKQTGPAVPGRVPRARPRPPCATRPGLG